MSARLFIVAGEASGDAHAARLIQAMTAMRPDLEVIALGGQRMKEAGADVRIPLAERGVTGFVEVLGQLSFFRKALATTEAILDGNRPDAVILVDFPGFNFRVARMAHKRGIPIIYYISPQVWAWHRSRVKKMKKWLTKILVIFPFEAEFFQKEGIEAEFVGNPLVEALAELEDPAQTRQQMGYGPDDILIALLPGSRKMEVNRMLKTMYKAAELIAQQMPSARFFLPLAETLPRSILDPMPSKPAIQVVENPTYAHRQMADFAITASGTATLENALLGVPMAVVYKCSWISYLLARSLAMVEHIGMVNILAGETVCEEFIQHEATPQALADYTCQVLQNPDQRQAIQQRLAEVRDSLGALGASQTAAKAIISTLKL